MRYPEEMVSIPVYLERMRIEIHGSVCDQEVWRYDAWERLYEFLCEEGEFVAELSPHAAAAYACAVEVAIEYLGRHPRVKRFKLLERRLSYDMSATANAFRAFDNLISEGQFNTSPFEAGEYELLTTSIGICLESYRSVERLCPDT